MKPDPRSQDPDFRIKNRYSVPAVKAHIFLLIFAAFLIAACNVQIYDLQPIIIGTNTPTPTEVQKKVFVGVTPTVPPHS